MRKTDLKRLVTSSLTVLGLLAASGAIAVTPAHAAVMATPARGMTTAPVTAQNNAGFGSLSPHQVTGSGSCSQVRKQLASLAKSGRRTVTCIEPVATSSTQALKPAQPSAVLRPADLPTWCTDTGWQGTRFDMCYIHDDQALNIDVDTGEQLGFAELEYIDDFALTYNSQQFTESFSLSIPVVNGTFDGQELNLALTCGVKTTCQAFGGFAGVPIVEDELWTGQFSYSDTTNTVDTNYISYVMTSGPQTVLPDAWTSPPFRCDNEIAGAAAGCVVPGIAPELTTMTNLPSIAKNIRAIQAAGPHHYGSEALGGLPLTRNQSLEGANRAVACSGAPVIGPGLTCDEYPFASTDQGASKTTKPDWGTAWVPSAENNSQGGYLTNFYRQFRVMDGNGTGDAFWVVV